MVIINHSSELDFFFLQVGFDLDQARSTAMDEVYDGTSVPRRCVKQDIWLDNNSSIAFLEADPKFIM